MTLLIESFLTEDPKQPITAGELGRLLGANVRVITAAIQRRRREGVPIIAGKGGRPGYYIATTADDMRDYCERLRREEKELRLTREACEDLISSLPEEA